MVVWKGLNVTAIIHAWYKMAIITVWLKWLNWLKWSDRVDGLDLLDWFEW